MYVVENGEKFTNNINLYSVTALCRNAQIKSLPLILFCFKTIHAKTTIEKKISPNPHWFISHMSVGESTGVKILPLWNTLVTTTTAARCSSRPLRRRTFHQQSTCCCCSWSHDCETALPPVNTGLNMLFLISSWVSLEAAKLWIKQFKKKNVKCAIRDLFFSNKKTPCM